eukprot:6191227-Pleurochrysis_carterae.AAC.2
MEEAGKGGSRSRQRAAPHDTTAPQSEATQSAGRRPVGTIANGRRNGPFSCKDSRKRESIDSSILLQPRTFLPPSHRFKNAQ